MKIGIILHPYGEDKPAGLARTIFELTNALITYGKDHEFIIYLKYPPRVLPAFVGSHWKIEILGGGLLWLEGLRTATPADVYVFNTPVLPPFYRSPKSVVLALDFAYKHLPAKIFSQRLQNKVMEYYHGFSLKRADRIIAMSEATKKDIVNFFRIGPQKITVGYWGFKSVCSVPPESVSVPARYFLFVGVVKERKNVLNIVKGFRDFLREHADFSLVIAGNSRGEYGDAIKAYIAHEGIASRVIFPGYVTEGQISYLYRHMQALVFPSLIEGFGFPVLEAMDCGVPVITSNISSLAELGANGSALLVDPHAPAQIAQAMAAIADDESLRGRLAKAGKDRSRLFVWDTRIKIFLDVITHA